MTDINSVILVGNIVRDVASDQNGFSYLQNGTALARVSLACNRSRKMQDGSWGSEVSYFDITIWGKTAENLKPYLLKGKKIAVQGFLKQERWTDQQGNNRSRIGIVAENVQLLTPNTQGQAQQGFSPDTVYPTAQAARQAESAGYGQPAQRQAQPNPVQPQGGEMMNFPKDIPF